MMSCHPSRKSDQHATLYKHKARVRKSGQNATLYRYKARGLVIGHMCALCCMAPFELCSDPIGV